MQSDRIKFIVANVMGHDLVRFISNDLENDDFFDEMFRQLAYRK